MPGFKTKQLMVIILELIINDGNGYPTQLLVGQACSVKAEFSFSVCKEKLPFDALLNVYQTEVQFVRRSHDHSHCTDKNK